MAWFTVVFLALGKASVRSADDPEARTVLPVGWTGYLLVIAALATLLRSLASLLTRQATRLDICRRCALSHLEMSRNKSILRLRTGCSHVSVLVVVIVGF